MDRCENASVSNLVRASPAEEAESPTKDTQHRLDLLHKPKARGPLFLLHRARRSSFSRQEKKKRGVQKAVYRRLGGAKTSRPCNGRKKPFSQQEKKKRGLQKKILLLLRKKKWGAQKRPAHAMGEKPVFLAERKRRGGCKNRMKKERHSFSEYLSFQTTHGVGKIQISTMPFSGGRVMCSVPPVV